MKKTILFLVLTCLVASIGNAQPLVNNPVGSVIFSKAPITSSSVTGEKSFRSSDFIYARLILNSGTIRDSLKVPRKWPPRDRYFPQFYCRYQVTIFKNNKVIHRSDNLFCQIKEEDLDKNYYDFDVLPDPLIARTAVSFTPEFELEYGRWQVPLYQSYGHISEDGTYKVRVTLSNPKKVNGGMETPQTEWTIFESEFDFNFRSSDKKVMDENRRMAANKVEKDFQNLAFQSKPLPEEWKLKSNPPAIAGFTAAKYNQMYLQYYPKDKIIKTYLDNGSGWGVTKDFNNIYPVYKYSQQWVTFFCKDEDGKCYYQTCSLRQNYEGNGKYGPVFLATFYDSNKKFVNCDKMK